MFSSNTQTTESAGKNVDFHQKPMHQNCIYSNSTANKIYQTEGENCNDYMKHADVFFLTHYKIMAPFHKSQGQS